MNNIRQMLSVYFVAGTQDCLHLAGEPSANLLRILEQALQAGITCFQFRDKGEHSLEYASEKQKQLAIQCLALCRQYQVPFIMNDNVPLALEIGADGIHVGQSDMAVSEILAQAQHKFILGLSTNNLADVLAAKDDANIDYLGVGPIFPTHSKADHSPALGVSFVGELKALGVEKPLVAIGGINESNAYILREQGADGVAVISAITQSQHLAETIQILAGKKKRIAP
ncbi:thiamine phosphate synthase [Pasteurella langaaensis]|nr:thiamine phosphate synthase [Pasteurella langaaensis]